MPSSVELNEEGTGVWSRFSALLDRDDRRVALVTAGLIVMSAALGIVAPVLTQAVVDRGLLAPGGVDLSLLTLYVGLALLAFVGAAMTGLWQSRRSEKWGNAIVSRLRVSLYAHTHRLPFQDISRMQRGDIQSRFNNDVELVRIALTDQVPSAIYNFVTVIASIIAMAFLSWQLTLLAVIFTPLFVVLQRRAGRLSHQISAEVQELLSSTATSIDRSASVQGVTLARLFGQQVQELRRFQRASDRQAELQVARAMAGARLFTTLQAFIGITPTLSYLIVGLANRDSADFSIGTAVAFGAVQLRVLFPAVQLLQVMTELEASDAGLERTAAFLSSASSSVEAMPVPAVMHSVTGRLTFDDVWFSYDLKEHDAEGEWQLAGLTWQVAEGNFVAVVGPSGAGKSTLTGLIPGLIVPQRGIIKIGQDDIAHLNVHNLRHSLGVVTQETFLFAGTVAQNLRYGTEASTEELWDVLESVNLANRFRQRDEGLDTDVGENGVNLSGGERQRLAIARALLRNPHILILDEATSALDVLTERMVFSAVNRARSTMSLIVVTHRMETVRHADSIIVLDRGRLIESGTHDELMRAGGLYATMARPSPI